VKQVQKHKVQKEAYLKNTECQSDNHVALCAGC